MNHKSHIVITGANGFIGGCLMRYFDGLNHPVTALVRQLPQKPVAGVSYVLYNMEQEPDKSLLIKDAILIHCAYSKKAGSEKEDINETGTIRLLHYARTNGVRQCIFFSSISATSSSGSYYAKQKSRLEKCFTGERDIIVRPGLVIGNGGLFKNTLHFINRYRVLPVIGKGLQPVYYIGMNDVLKALYELLEQQRYGVFYLCHANSKSYKDFYGEVALHFNKRITFIPVPVWLLKIAISVYALVSGGKINSDNLKGLNEVPELEATIMGQSKFSFSLQSLAESLQHFDK